MADQHKKCSVLVFKETENGREACAIIFRHKGLKADEDFQFAFCVDDVVRFVEPQEDQLLIIGSFPNKREKAVQLVKDMKDKNPKLRVLLYSSFALMNDPANAVFDRMIDTLADPMGEKLVAEISKFNESLRLENAKS